MAQPANDTYSGPSGETIYGGRFGPAPQAARPGVGVLTISGYAPTVTQSGSNVVNPGAGVLAITGYAPQVLRSVPDNWSTRSTYSGVVRANRLNASLTVTSATTTPGPWVLSDGLQGNVSFDSTIAHKTAGGSQKFAVLAADGPNDGNIGLYFGDVYTFGDGDVCWTSFMVQAPAAWCYQPWNCTSLPTQAKLSIISYHGYSHSNNEVVITTGLNNDNFLFGYADNHNASAFPYETPFNSIQSSSDFKFQGVVDNSVQLVSSISYPLTGNNPDTGAAWTGYDQQRAQFGGMYAVYSLAAPHNEFQIGLGDPLSGAYRLPPGEWTCIVQRVARGVSGNAGTPDFVPGAATSRVTIWVERQSVPGLKKVVDFGYGGQAGTIVEQGIDFNYDTLWLLPYVTTRIANSGTQVSGRTNNITGAQILATGFSTPTGNGTLTYNAGTKLFQFNGNGESPGNSRGFSVANGILKINVEGATANSYLILQITPASLPTSGTTTDTITIAAGRPDTQINYNDAIVSRLPILSPGGSIPTGVSTLGDLAANMTPGTWQQLTPTNQNSVLTGGAASGSSLLYCTYFPWDPIKRRVTMCGMDHDVTIFQHTMVYDDPTNTFVMVASNNGIQTLGSTPTHGYGDTVVNPYTGDIYQRAANASQFTFEIWKSAYNAAGVLTLFQDVTDSTNLYFQLASVASWWWTGPYTGQTLGAQGAAMFFSSASVNVNPVNGNVVIFDPLATVGYGAGKTVNTYSNIFPTGNGYTSGENCFGCYSRIYNCAVMGGGDTQPNKIRRLNSDGTTTALTDIPNIGAGLSIGPVACDPVTGKFIFLSGNNLYQLDPSLSGTWTSLGTKPAGVGDPTAGGMGVVTCSIPDYGVIMYITQQSASGGTTYLYKNA